MSDFELPPNKETKRSKSSASSVAELSSKKDSTPEATEVDKDAEEKVKLKWTPEELLAIFDDIIFSGEYSEVMDIRGKLKVRFRTRSAEEVEKISQIIDGTTATLVATLNEKRSLLNLHYALTMYAGTDLSTVKHEEKVKFINKLPAPVVGALINCLFKFDDKIYAACKEGEENF
jgi:hypothetical protein